MKSREETVSKFNDVSIDLNKFNGLNINEKNDQLKEILADAFGKRSKVKSDTLLKIINLAKDKDTKVLHLDNSITVENTGNELVFKISKIKVLPIILFYVGLLIFLSCAATFSYLGDLKRNELNIDIDNDGVAEINIDVDNDEIADVNIDLDGDKKPDRNIDYMNNWKSVFNIEKDGKVLNKVNQDTNNDGKCDLNCDINDDGWPELNIDLDGDGLPDMFIDRDNVGYATTNIDTDGDGVCDTQCDYDLDGKCDGFCVAEEKIEYRDRVEYQYQYIIVNGDVNQNTHVGTSIPALQVLGAEVNCNDLYPTDQPQENAKKECTGTLTIRNLSTLNLKYKIDLKVDNYTYISDNFKYKLNGTNGGGNMNNYVTVPRSNSTVFNNLTIPALATQTYNVSFILEGTNENQNYDTNRIFDGEFSVIVME